MNVRSWVVILAALVGLPLLPAGCLDLIGDDCRVLNTCSANGGAAGYGGDGRAGAAGSFASGATSGGGFPTEGAFQPGGSGGGSGCGLACAGAGSFCDEDAGLCVECVEDTDCHGARCDVRAGRCVACLDRADCSSAVPVCVAGVCSACRQSSDCRDEADARVCDTRSGACVECAGDVDCDGKLCAPLTRRCTQLEPRAKFACDACEHDAECQDGQLCVAQVFEGMNVGNFCMWTKSAHVGDGTCSQDGRPFALLAAQSVSVDEVAADLCVLQLTTCPAYSAHRHAFCSGPDDDAACGVPDLDDGLCRLNLEAVPLCTHPCGIDVDCKPGYSCTPGGYCSL